jgi:hypothetical protein
MMNRMSHVSKRRRRALLRDLEGHPMPLVRIGLAVVAAVSAASAIASMSTM